METLTELFRINVKLLQNTQEIEIINSHIDVIQLSVVGNTFTQTRIRVN